MSNWAFPPGPKDDEYVKKLRSKVNWHVARAGSRTASHVAAQKYSDEADRVEDQLHNPVFGAFDPRNQKKK